MDNQEFVTALEQLSAQLKIDFEEEKAWAVEEGRALQRLFAQQADDVKLTIGKLKEAFDSIEESVRGLHDVLDVMSADIAALKKSPRFQSHFCESLLVFAVFFTIFCVTFFYVVLSGKGQDLAALLDEYIQWCASSYFL